MSTAAHQPNIHVEPTLNMKATFSEKRSFFPATNCTCTFTYPYYTLQIPMSLNGDV
jgi:hypothetical protein